MQTKHGLVCCLEIFIIPQFRNETAVTYKLGAQAYLWNHPVCSGPSYPWFHLWNFLLLSKTGRTHNPITTLRFTEQKDFQLCKGFLLLKVEFSHQLSGGKFFPLQCAVRVPVECDYLFMMLLKVLSDTPWSCVFICLSRIVMFYWSLVF